MLFTSSRVFLCLSSQFFSLAVTAVFSGGEKWLLVTDLNIIWSDWGVSGLAGAVDRVSLLPKSEKVAGALLWLCVCRDAVEADKSAMALSPDVAGSVLRKSTNQLPKLSSVGLRGGKQQKLLSCPRCAEAVAPASRSSTMVSTPGLGLLLGTAWVSTRLCSEVGGTCPKQPLWDSVWPHAKAWSVSLT